MSEGRYKALGFKRKMARIKSKATIRTCLNQTGAKVTFDCVFRSRQRNWGDLHGTASLREAVALRRLRSAAHRRQLAAPALDVWGAIDLRRAGCQSGPVRLHRLLQESSWILAAGARRQGLPQYPMNGQAYRTRSVESAVRMGDPSDPSVQGRTHRGSKQDSYENIWFRNHPN